MPDQQRSSQYQTNAHGLGMPAMELLNTLAPTACAGIVKVHKGPVIFARRELGVALSKSNGKLFHAGVGSIALCKGNGNLFRAGVSVLACLSANTFLITVSFPDVDSLSVWRDWYIRVSLVRRACYVPTSRTERVACRLAWFMHDRLCCTKKVMVIVRSG